VKQLADRNDVNVLAISSALPNVFSAGADVREHLGRNNVAAMLRAAHGLIAELLRFPVPTLCAARGNCLGGAFELMLACDQWLAGAEAGFGLPEITLGCYPPAALVLAPHKLPAALAAEMIQTGRVLPAPEFCARAGCAAVAAPDFENALAQSAQRHAALPRGVLVEATRLLRCGAAERFAAAASGLEAAYLERLLALNDATLGPKAFLAKSRPDWDHQSVV
jgi:cyclohexa-1,5-dienecarbonyl-CoA hydratase